MIFYLGIGQWAHFALNSTFQAIAYCKLFRYSTLGRKHNKTYKNARFCRVVLIGFFLSMVF